MTSLRTVVAVIIGSVAAPALAAESVEEALSGGEFSIDARYRYEFVDQAGFTKDAGASTLRTRIGWVSGEWQNLALGLTLEDVRVFGEERYNDTANGFTQYPVVGDPADTELDEGWLRWNWDARSFKIGKQKIIRGNARFIGNVGFRQNQQTYDGLTFTSGIGEDGSLFYGHIERVNRVFGAHHPTAARARTDVSADLVNFGWDFDIADVTLYSYMIENQDTPTASHITFGLRASGERAVGDGDRITWFAELAEQGDYKDGSTTNDASYHHLGLTYHRDRFRVGFGWEVLGGDGVYGFQTPLATLHAFNGWADKFLTTPASGIDNFYISGGAKLGEFDLMAVYHRFDPDSGSASLGDEIDLVLRRKLNDSFSFEFKLADYSADSFSTDTTKVWITFGYKY